jgi:hypothetical protein
MAFLGKLQFAGDDARVAADADRVAASFVISILRRARQAADDGHSRLFQFAGALANFGLQTPGVIAEMIVIGFQQQRVANARNQLVGVDRLAQEIGGPGAQRLRFDGGVVHGR